LVIFGIEGQVNEDDFPDGSFGGGFTESVYKGFTAAFGGGLLLSPKSTGGKIVATGLSLSLMVCMSIYGAQVTTALVESRLTSSGGSISSFEEGLDRKVKFCAHWFLMENIKARWPSIQLVEAGRENSVADFFDYLHEGRCEASIIPDEWWWQAQTGSFSGEGTKFYETVYSKHTAQGQEDAWKRYHCDDKLYPLPVKNLPFNLFAGVPVNPELARPFTAAILNANNDPDRKYSLYSTKYIEKFLPAASGCAAGQEVATGDDEVRATVIDGIGSTMVSMIFTAAGVLWWAVDTIMKRGAEKQDMDSSQTSSSDEMFLKKVHASLEAQRKSLQAIEKRLDDQRGPPSFPANVWPPPSSGVAQATPVAMHSWSRGWG